MSPGRPSVVKMRGSILREKEDAVLVIKTRKQLNFEKSLERLEAIISEMENENLDLDRALALFSEGAELVKFCSAKLNETKKKIEVITSSGEIKDFKGLDVEEKL